MCCPPACRGPPDVPWLRDPRCGGTHVSMRARSVHGAAAHCLPIVARSTIHTEFATSPLSTRCRFGGRWPSARSYLLVVASVVCGGASLSTSGALWPALARTVSDHAGAHVGARPAQLAHSRGCISRSPWSVHGTRVVCCCTVYRPITKIMSSSTRRSTRCSSCGPARKILAIVVRHAVCAVACCVAARCDHGPS